MKSLYDLPTPSLILDAACLEANLSKMAEALPGDRKAHKCTALARRQRAAGHERFTCATIREMEVMAEAGLGDDLLLANEVLDASRLGRLDARVTLAIDSEETLSAAVSGGVREVLIDVNVGLPRCGCAPDRAGALADAARKAGLGVRGVMGYEGHVVGIADRGERESRCEESMKQLLAAHAATGGEVISAGGTGTYDCNPWATEIQAGSYALMDTAYRELGHPFVQALWLWLSVISVSKKYAVADGGLKCLGMDHGNPTLEAGKVWFCSDEHLTFAPEGETRVGDRVRVTPAHIDPSLAYHERIYVLDGEAVVDEWPIDMRGW
ncbi:MAG: alanine racemase [Deltaproteobacteria bacterium]|nr:alanine racemase [Deltaproteobacteria bacterium]